MVIWQLKVAIGPLNVLTAPTPGDAANIIPEANSKFSG